MSGLGWNAIASWLNAGSPYARGASVKTILIANAKGGSRKDHVATNIAGWLAGRKQRVALADIDPQRSATQWLQRRPPLFPEVQAWRADRGLRRGNDTLLPLQRLVVDSPKGLSGDELRNAILKATMVLVPTFAVDFRYRTRPADFWPPSSSTKPETR